MHVKQLVCNFNCINSPKRAEKFLFKKIHIIVKSNDHSTKGTVIKTRSPDVGSLSTLTIAQALIFDARKNLFANIGS